MLGSDNSDCDAFYCPELVKRFYIGIDIFTLDLDRSRFMVHFDCGGSPRHTGHDS